MKLLQLSAALIAAGVLAGCAPKGPEPITTGVITSSRSTAITRKTAIRRSRLMR